MSSQFVPRARSGVLRVLPEDEGREACSSILTTVFEGPVMMKKLFMTAAITALMLGLNSNILLAQSNARNWSVNFGPNAKNWGYVGVTRDFPLNEHFSLFATGGWGATFVGGGTAFYATSIYKSSLVVSGTAGIIGAHVDVAYQWKAGKRGFVTTGASYGHYFLQYNGFLPVLSYELRF